MKGAADHAEAAFLAGCHQSAGLDGWSLGSDTAYIAALESFEAQVPVERRLGGVVDKIQKQLSAMIEAVALQRLIDEAPIDRIDEDRARLRSTAGANTVGKHKDAGAFWNVVPSRVLRLDIPSALLCR